MIKSIKITLSACHLVTLSFFLPTCTSSHMLDRRYDYSRPDYGATALPNPGPDSQPAPHVTLVNPDPTKEMPPIIEQTITGTWNFTTPATTTRVERKTGAFHQFSIYLGRPSPTDTPFVVITVSADPRSEIESNPDNYNVKGVRTYSLNGNIAKEWAGTTKSGESFCELIISKPGAAKGDQCHAFALAKNDEQRKLALEILGSITWQANTSQ
jgi:hypothetical protein